MRCRNGRGSFDDKQGSLPVLRIQQVGAWAAGQAGTASSRQTPASQREEAVP